jgi:hypothetical protein
MKKQLLLALVVAGTSSCTPYPATRGDVHIGISIPVGPRFYFERRPDFIYLDDYGFSVSWGSPYDVIYLGNAYFIFQSGYWYRAYDYRGPWGRVGSFDIPAPLRRHQLEDIRRRREFEYRRHERNYWDDRFRQDRDRWQRPDDRPRIDDRRREDDRRGFVPPPAPTAPRGPVLSPPPPPPPPPAPQGQYERRAPERPFMPAPAGPVRPVEPVRSWEPPRPARPVEPSAPVRPLGPMAPAGPVAPPRPQFPIANPQERPAQPPQPGGDERNRNEFRGRTFDQNRNEERNRRDDRGEPQRPGDRDGRHRFDNQGR